MVTETRKLTYEDYAKTPDDERYELLDGELVFMPSPSIIHQMILLKLARLLEVVDYGVLGWVFIAPIDVVLSATCTLQPDILFVSKDRKGIITELNVQGAPDLTIEILSASDPNRDRVRKRAIYERHGVGEYWLVDPDAREITALLLADGGYETAGIYTAGDTLTSPTLPGFEIEVGEVF